jgi:ubiquinone/menaquinone biosynthesis C-methylase UbiE
MSSSDFPDYVQQNVAVWTRSNAAYTDAQAERSWRREDITWGIWRIPESQLNVIGDVNGLDVIELGCGTAYFSSWLARRGARVVGVDPTPAQLETARRMQRETGIEFELIEGIGEAVPKPDRSFDLAFSEYGASIWADPYKWIPEAARLLRPDGRLIFLCNSTISVLTMTLEGASKELQRPQKGMHRIEWSDTGEVEFHIAHSAWIELFRANGLAVERMLELYAPEDAHTHTYYDYVTPEWASQWANEELWVVRKLDG